MSFMCLVAVVSFKISPIEITQLFLSGQEIPVVGRVFLARPTVLFLA